MKNVITYIKKGILAVVMLASVLGFAKEDKIIIKEDSKKTALILDNVKEGNFIYIKDNLGSTLYTELVEVNGVYKKGFDLNQLPNGNYFFEIERGLEINTIPFSVEGNKVAFNKKEETTFYKPLTRQHNNLVLVSKLSTKKEIVNVNIYANYGNDFELIHTEEIENIEILERVYKLDKGNYKIVINSNNKEYTTFINN